VRITIQEPLTWEELPEWAAKDWQLLVFREAGMAMEDEYSSYLGFGHTRWRSVFRHGEYYYVDPESYDPEAQSYTLITGETLFTGGRSATLGKTNIRESVEGPRAWMFPCVEKGKWHAALRGMESPLTQEDCRWCETCERSYHRGRIEFQTETGNLCWSR
jgi:hypothetical protein